MAFTDLHEHLAETFGQSSAFYDQIAARRPKQRDPHTRGEVVAIAKAAREKRAVERAGRAKRTWKLSAEQRQLIATSDYCSHTLAGLLGVSYKTIVRARGGNT